jgi:hypothetical protein
MEFRGEGVKDPCHHDDVQSSPIDKWIGNVRDDMVIKDIATKCEKHKVASPLIVERRGFQNNRDNWSYVLEAGSMRV